MLNSVRNALSARRGVRNGGSASAGNDEVSRRNGVSRRYRLRKRPSQISTKTVYPDPVVGPVRQSRQTLQAKPAGQKRPGLRMPETDRPGAPLAKGDRVSLTRIGGLGVAVAASLALSAAMCAPMAAQASAATGSSAPAVTYHSGTPGVAR